MDDPSSTHYLLRRRHPRVNQASILSSTELSLTSSTTSTTPRNSPRRRPAGTVSGTVSIPYHISNHLIYYVNDSYSLAYTSSTSSTTIQPRRRPLTDDLLRKQVFRFSNQFLSTTQRRKITSLISYPSSTSSTTSRQPHRRPLTGAVSVFDDYLTNFDYRDHTNLRIHQGHLKVTSGSTQGQP